MSDHEVRLKIAEIVIPEQNAIARYLYVYGERDEVLLEYLFRRDSFPTIVASKMN